MKLLLTKFAGLNLRLCPYLVTTERGGRVKKRNSMISFFCGRESVCVCERERERERAGKEMGGNVVHICALLRVFMTIQDSHINFDNYNK